MISMAALDSIFAPTTGPASGPALILTPLDATLAGVDLAQGRSSISLACTTCRSRHMKCDGLQPCARCRDDGQDCVYVKSRRGYKGPRRLKTRDGGSALGRGSKRARTGDDVSGSLKSVNAPFTNELDAPMMPVQVKARQNVYTGSAPNQSWGHSSSPDVSSSNSDSEISSAIANILLPVELNNDAWPGSLFINSYFEQFHHCHPFLPPRGHALHMIRTQNLPHLVAAMELVGSFYTRSAPSVAALDTVNRILEQVQTRDGSYVQAMLLLVIALQMADRTDQANDVIASATGTAMEIGLHRREYAWVHGGGSPIMEECWRRTWWELYLVNGMMAAMSRAPFTLYDVDADCLLPCEEAEYTNGQIPPPKSMADLDDAEFLATDEAFSSFTYRVDAIRRTGFAFKALGLDPLCAETLELADAALANWHLQLPESKRDAINRHGILDEMMFQAHMLAAACGALLSHPRSDLNTDDVISIKTCVGGSPRNLPGDNRSVYTAKALSAANAVTKLMLLPYPLQKHSPFFSCITTMSAMVYLSYWSLCVIDGSDAFVKEQIKLCLGTLKNLSELWPIAMKVLSQVKAVAQELYAVRKAINSENWAAITQGEILQGFVVADTAQPQLLSASPNGVSDSTASR